MEQYRNEDELLDAYPGCVVLDTAKLGIVALEDRMDEAVGIGLNAIGRRFEVVLLEGRRVFVLKDGE